MYREIYLTDRRFNIISRAKKYVAVLLVFVCVCMIFSPQTAYAAEDSSQHETVKVGFFAMDGYHVMDEEGNRSGYGYDFLRLMARYWDVDYEYVGYDKSWDDMQQMLEDGEIDMVTSARKTPDREEKFDFSRPIGTNNGILTVRSDNSTIVDGNYSTYNGMRVALFNGSSEIKSFADFAGNKGFTYDPFYFDTTAEMEEALQSGNVDAIAASSLRKTNNERIVDKFDSSDFYVIVKKGNTELLNEINYAIDQMNAVEGDWKTTLYNKNYESIETKNLEYTKKEKSIISQYSKDNPLHVLCDPTRYPYSYNENGEMKGIIPDYFRKIADYAGISYEFLTPATRDEYIAYQKNKEATEMSIDARLETDNYAETKKWGLTAPFITMQLARVTRCDFDGEINVVTVWVLLIFGWLLTTMAVIAMRLSARKKAQKVAQETAEEMAELAEHAQAANKAKTAFLSHMSHDMRTPMNAIIGFTGIAMKNNPSDEVKNCLEKIDESSEHLLSLINDVLDLTHIESGKVKYNPVPADVKNITDSALDITKGFLTNRGISFKIQREEAKIPNVLVDPVRLRDVLVNILSNAVKFTPDGGTIIFEARCQEKGGDGYINMHYRISDTGIGMSEEFTKEVFEEFAQEDSDVRTQYHGVGLGMAIVKKYVDMMGGTISVQSKKHEGTTFTVDIPLEITDKECNKSDTGFSEKVNLTGVKVLLAEDNELNAEIATVQLEEFRMNVERAVDGKNAVEIFRNHPEGTFDVILMDIMMPEMNGYEAAKAIRAMNDRPDGKNIPIIAMTANSFAEDVQASLDAGMNAHLSKPIVIDEVIKTILRYVHND